MRSRHWWLVGLAIVALFAIALLFLPASLVTRWLPPGVATGDLTGTIWNGAAAAVTVEGRPLGAARWQLRPAQLLRGRVAVDALVVNKQSSLRGAINLAADGTVDARDLQGTWSIADLPVRALPPGWTGEVHLALPALRLEAGALTHALGTIELRGLREPPPGAIAIGSYRVTFDEQSLQDQGIVGRLQDLEGPMSVSGTVTLGSDRSYVIDGLVAARADAPATMVERLRYLGRPDAQGRRPFSVAGTY